MIVTDSAHDLIVVPDGPGYLAMLDGVRHWSRCPLRAAHCVFLHRRASLARRDLTEIDQHACGYIASSLYRGLRARRRG